MLSFKPLKSRMRRRRRNRRGRGRRRESDRQSLTKIRMRRHTVWWFRFWQVSFFSGCQRLDVALSRVGLSEKQGGSDRMACNAAISVPPPRIAGPAMFGC